LEGLDGVVNAEVSFEEKAATVHYDSVKVTPEQMMAVISTVGFRTSRAELPTDQRFHGQGTVVAVDPQKGTVTLDHGAIPGLMPPMTMAFVVDSPEALRGLQPGDTVAFTLQPRGVTVTIAELAVVKK
jgi:Cu(I)/Ag(I) efflux system protein CusF